LKAGKNLLAGINGYFERRSNISLFLWGLTGISIVGFGDYITGHEIGFTIFYLLPISLTAWFAGRSVAVMMCLISAVVEFWANAAAGRTYSHVLISFWNSAVSFWFFLLYVLILSMLKSEYNTKTRLIAELRDSYAELERTKDDLERKSQELVRSNDDLKDFAYAASHDLQEPLRIIRGYVQLLAKRYKGKLGADADDFIKYAVEGVGRMQRLIKDLLEYSRLGTNGETLKTSECTELVDRALANLQAAIEESGAEVTYDHLPVIAGDPSQLSRVFQNLIGNAIKFRGDEAPKIRISAERKGEEWVFSVRDNGIGIDPDQSDRIFMIFQRLHTREEYEGTGIGLAICKKIVERHGGRIWVESEAGRGATFYFTVPIGKKDKEHFVTEKILTT
jgi:signal transduction histidine kinase